MSPTPLTDLLTTLRSQPPLPLICLAITLLAVFYILSRPEPSELQKKHSLPPGPEGIPGLGNLRDVPAERSDLQFERWGKEFGSDVIYLNLMGQPVVVLNSVAAATELLDKRGANYSDRPPFAVLEALGFKNNLALTPDGPLFRKLRKAYGDFSSKSGSAGYRDAQVKYAGVMAEEIERSPGRWTELLSRYATRVIFNMAFAIDVVDEEDEYFKLADKMGWIISNMGTTGLSAMDIAPWLEHIPRWIGKSMPSVKYVHDHAPTIESFHQRPFDATMKSFKEGTLKPSFIGRLIEARESEKEDPSKSFTDAELRGTGGSIYSAGHDTTFASEMIFVMGMLLSPNVQRQAQKEIDSVTGGTRLPNFEDWQALPMVERIVYETFRFHAVVPNGIPHKTLKEDVYRDMYIPKGAMIITNLTAMLHDPTIYKDPLRFHPDRYLNGEPFPVAQFGFGRRVCPGQYLGLASVWIVVATILAKFTIAPLKDENGKDILPKRQFTTGITSHPVPFDCVFTPRNSL